MADAPNWIEPLQQEIDGYYEIMKQFNQYEPAEIFLYIAAWSARASEIRSKIVRVESRRAQAFRTRELDPFLDELDRQFRIHSRVVTIRQHEWDMQKGV